MIYQNLAPILSAFIGRMSLNDMHQIKRAVDNCWHEQNSGSASTQDTAGKQYDGVIKAVVDRMLQSDRDYIVQTIERLT
jgi:hypothetical protein